MHHQKTGILGAVALMALFVCQLHASPDPLVCVADGEFQPPPVAPVPQQVATILGFNVYLGATPPNADPQLPILAFVQGLHGVASGWWGDTNYHGRNDMYDAAYARGYRTIFLESFGEFDSARTSIEHGFVLKTQLAALANAIGVEKFNLIAHSKGGPDSNFAAIMGAPIDSIVTLSGAHYGSPLADLAQVDFLAFLAELLGFNDAGTKFLQTGCMSLIRGFLDTHPANDSLAIYTTAGTSWGPLLSELSIGGLYLATACPGDGANDGLVCVDHAKHPLARDAGNVVTGEHRVVWDPDGTYELDHDNIRMGNAPVDFLFSEDCNVPVFDSIEPYIREFHGSAVPASSSLEKWQLPDPMEALAATSPEPLSLIVRGGPVAPGVTVEEFPVEDGIEGIELRVLVGNPRVSIELVDPQGTRFPMSALAATKSPVFRGAFEGKISLTSPRAGSWKLTIRAGHDGAFAMIAALQGNMDLQLSVPQAMVLRTGQSLPLLMQGKVREIRTTATVKRVSSIAAKSASSKRSINGTGVHQLRFDAPGVYNIALVSEGNTAAGLPFERTKVVSVGVVDPGTTTRALAGLPSACQ